MNTVFDLNKVQYANFWYENQDGVKTPRKPKRPTVHAQEIDPNELAGNLPEHPGETMLQRATRRGLLDRWTAKIRLQMSGCHALVFQGDRAVKLREAWNARIFGGKNAK